MKKKNYCTRFYVVLAMKIRWFACFVLHFPHTLLIWQSKSSFHSPPNTTGQKSILLWQIEETKMFIFFYKVLKTFLFPFLYKQQFQIIMFYMELPSCSLNVKNEGIYSIKGKKKIKGKFVHLVDSHDLLSTESSKKSKFIYLHIAKIHIFFICKL